MSRTMRGGATVACETLRIFELDGRLLYADAPSGQQATEFRAVEVSDSLASRWTRRFRAAIAIGGVF